MIKKEKIHFVLPTHSYGKCKCGGMVLIYPVSGNDGKYSKKFSIKLTCKCKLTQKLRKLAQKRYTQILRIPQKHNEKID